MTVPPPGGTPGGGRGDHEADMTPSRVITDDVIEAMLRHEPVDPAFAPLAAFARHVPAVGDGPAPRPSDELAAMFEGRIRPGFGTAGAPRVMAVTTAPDAPAAEEAARPGPQRLASLASKVAGLGLVAKIGLGTSLAAASVAGGGAAGVLPPAANDTVRDAIEAVSPVEFGDTDDGPRHAGDPASTGPSAGPGGAGDQGDRPATDDDAPAADQGPAVADAPPPQPGETTPAPSPGTPAAPAVPDTTPGATAPSTVPPARPDDPGQGNPPQSVPSTVPPHEVDPTVTSTTTAAQSDPGS